MVHVNSNDAGAAIVPSAPRALFFGGALCSREDLEALVGNRLAALDREAVRAGCEPCLRAFDRRELLAQVGFEPLVELVLVEVGREVAGVDIVGRLAVVDVCEAAKPALDAPALRLQELACAVRVHRRQAYASPAAEPARITVMREQLRVVAAAIVEDGKVLLVSKRAAPDVFYLPGGKPDGGEAPLATLARELDEELGVTLAGAEPFAVVEDEAALEGTPMEMHVFLASVGGAAAARAEIATLVWVGADGHVPGRLAPAIRNHVLPQLRARGLLACDKTVA